jgi:hypothetical protein
VSSPPPPPPPPPPPTTIEGLYDQFWYLSHQLFVYVCHPHRHYEECLVLLERKLSV